MAGKDDIKELYLLVVVNSPDEQATLETHFDALSAFCAPRCMPIVHWVNHLDDAHNELPQGSYNAILLVNAQSTLDTVQRLSWLRSAHRNTPIIVLANRDLSDTGLGLIEAGAQDSLTIDELQPQRLWQAIRFAIEREGRTRNVDHSRDALSKLRSTLRGQPPLRAQSSRQPEGEWGPLAQQRLLETVERHFAQPNNTPVALLHFTIAMPIEGLHSGHGARLRLLTRLNRALKEALQDALQDSGTVISLDADEFVCFSSKITDADDAAQLAESAQALFNSITANSGVTFAVHLHCGIAMSSVSSDPRTLIQQANFANQACANQPDLPCRFFDPGLLRSEHRASRILGRLQEAHADKVCARYQPIFSLPEQRMIGVEALMRISDPEYGLLAPGEFISVAAKAGLLQRMEAVLLAQSAQDWSGELIDQDLFLAFNVSVPDLLSKNFARTLRALIANNGLPADRVRIEISESELQGHLPPLIPVLSELRDAGLGIHLDDFGTGLSSIKYLSALPITAVKIDGSIANESLGSRTGTAIFQGCFSLANAFKLPVIAEGIESSSALTLLSGLGCHMAQGYALCPPGTFVEIDAFTRRKEQQHAAV